MIRNVLGDVTSGHQLAALSHLRVLLTGPLRETPLLRHHDLLTTRELHLRTTKSLDHHLLLVVLGADRDDRLTDSHTSHQIVRLTEGVTHTRLQSIGAGARKHLVDTRHVVGVATHSHVEAVLAAVLHQVLVGSNTGSLQSLAGQLLTLIGKHVGHEGISIHASALVTDIEDLDLGICFVTHANCPYQEIRGRSGT